MELRKFSLTSYKGYAEQADLEVAPLTILVGPNNAGKTAMAQALQLLAGGLTAPDDAAGEPLPLQSGGLRHGDSFEDLVTGRAVHGLLRMSITLASDAGEKCDPVLGRGRKTSQSIARWLRLGGQHG